MQDKVRFVSLLLTFVACTIVLRMAAPGDNENYHVRILADRKSDEICKGLRSVELTDAEEGASKVSNSFITALQNGNQLEEKVLKSDNPDWMAWGLTFIPVVVPWAALLVIGFLLYCITCWNFCCMVGCYKNCCKQAKCCRCCKLPKEERRICLSFSTVMGIAGALGVFGAAIPGIMYASKLSSDWRQLRCSVFKGIDDFTFGNEELKWVGLISGAAKLTSIASDFTSTFQNVNYNNDAVSDMEDLSTELSDMLDDIYNTYEATEVDTANPDNAGNTVVPDVIAGLGPITDTSSYLGGIDQEQKAKVDVAKQAANNIMEQLDSISSNLEPLQTSLNDATKMIGDFEIQFTGYETSVYDSTQTADDIISKHIKGALVGIFVAAIVISFITVLCPIGACIFKKNWMNNLLFVAWNFFHWMSCLGFLLGIILLPVGVILKNGCDILEPILNEKDGLQNMIGGYLKVDGSQLKLWDECFFGDGIMVNSFGLNDFITQIGSIQTSFEDASGVLPSNLGADSILIPEFYEQVSGVVDGKIYVVVSPTDQDGSAYNIKAFNSLTNYAVTDSDQNDVANCQKSQDEWVFNTDVCVAATKWDSSNGDTDSTGFNSPICISIDATLNDNNRYTSVTMTGCGQVSGEDLWDRIHAYRDALQAHLTDAQTKLNPLAAQIGDGTDPLVADITNKNAALVAKLKDVTQPIEDLSTELEGTLAAFIGPDTGLLDNMRCKFLGVRVREIQTAMCDGMVNTFLQIATAIVFMSMFGCFGSFFHFCTAKYMKPKLEKSHDEHKVGKGDNFGYGAAPAIEMSAT